MKRLFLILIAVLLACNVQGATNYPGSLDSYSTKAASDTIAEGHINDPQDAIEAIEAKVGTGASTATDNTVLRGTGAGTTAFGQVDSGDMSNVFGAWASKNKDTSYEAATDGFVLAFGACEPTEWITIKTDAANPPTTVRAQAGSWGFDVRDGAMCPVKKGDYYKVEDEGGTISDLTIYWIPIGS